ncbi:MAG: hypothetical protein ACTHL8_17315 [Burkholderiaceae bacterium]
MSEPKVYPDPSPPGRLAKGVRATFGALLGLVVAGALWIHSGFPGVWAAVVEAAVATGACA